MWSHVTTQHKIEENPVLVCFLGKIHPGHWVLMFIQPLLAVATRDAVTWRWKSSRAQSSKISSARSSRIRAGLCCHLHTYTQSGLVRQVMGLDGLWPGHQHFKVQEERVLGKIRKRYKIKSNAWALPWRKLFQGVIGSWSGRSTPENLSRVLWPPFFILGKPWRHTAWRQKSEQK